MVKIEYVDGTEETVETVGDIILKKHNPITGTSCEVGLSRFEYVKDAQIFIVRDHENEWDCMMIPREFVKSIRHIEV